jgi:thioester reductase-like protein
VSIVYFFTGFPGFLATKLIEELSIQDPDASFHLLVHESQLEKAKVRIDMFENQERYSILTGDITEEGLGLDHSLSRGDITHVFHLAAIYDLAVPQSAAQLVNVSGTRRVLEWLLTLGNLKRFVYFSTAYVSGTRTGTVYEHELIKGQAFKNHYESTKFEAEVLVQERMAKIPTTIIRPGIVVGDSKTGETVKFDGPYFIMRFLDKFAKLPIPYIGRGDVPVCLVPVDYIVKAVCFLTHIEAGEGKTYHLTDPNPFPARELYQEIVQQLLGKKPSWVIPTSLISGFLSIPAFRRWVQVEKETMDYFLCETYYDASNTVTELQGSGIICPTFDQYAETIIQYYKQSRTDPEKAILVK